MADGTGWPDPELHAVQAAAEGVQITGHVTFRGKQFRLGPSVGENAGMLSMLEFAEAASAGMGAEDYRAMASMLDMLRGCFILAPSCGTCKECNDEKYEECKQRDEGDWPRFRRLAKMTQARGEEVFEVINQVMEQAAARPTSPRSGSSAPARQESARSRDLSSLPEAFRKDGPVVVSELLR